MGKEQFNFRLVRDAGYLIKNGKSNNEMITYLMQRDGLSRVAAKWYVNMFCDHVAKLITLPVYITDYTTVHSGLFGCN